MIASQRLLIAICIAMLIALVAIFWPPAIYVLVIYDACLVLIALLDWIMLQQSKKFILVEVAGETTWSRGRAQDIEYTVFYKHKSRSIQVRCRGDWPRQDISVDPDVHDLTLAPRQVAKIVMKVTSLSRGSFTTRGLFIELRSPLGFSYSQRCYEAPLTISVYPDLNYQDAYGLLARANRLHQGRRRRRAANGDNEFERLRQYQQGDSLNRIDWKASARSDEIIVRDFQATQCQNITILVDHGRLMATRLASNGAQQMRQMLDEVIDAALLLGHVALNQRDLVGMVTFADRVTHWQPPKSGKSHFNHMVHGLHNLNAESVLSRFDSALLHVAQHQRKRSLVVMITHVLDLSSAKRLHHHIQAIAHRHLPLIILIKDPDVEDMLPEPNEQFDPHDGLWWQRAAACTVALERRQIVEKLRHAGSLVVESTAEDLSAQVVSEYLRVKAMHLL